MSDGGSCVFSQAPQAFLADLTIDAGDDEALVISFGTVSDGILAAALNAEAYLGPCHHSAAVELTSFSLVAMASHAQTEDLLVDNSVANSHGITAHVGGIAHNQFEIVSATSTGLVDVVIYSHAAFGEFAFDVDRTMQLRVESGVSTTSAGITGGAALIASVGDNVALGDVLWEAATYLQVSFGTSISMTDGILQGNEPTRVEAGAHLSAATLSIIGETVHVRASHATIFFLEVQAFDLTVHDVDVYFESSLIRGFVVEGSGSVVLSGSQVVALDHQSTFNDAVLLHAFLCGTHVHDVASTGFVAGGGSVFIAPSSRVTLLSYGSDVQLVKKRRRKRDTPAAAAGVAALSKRLPTVAKQFECDYSAEAIVGRCCDYEFQTEDGGCGCPDRSKFDCTLSK